MKYVKIYEAFSGKTVLFLHGYMGKPSPEKVMLMRSEGFDVIAPHLHYEEKPAWDIIMELCEIHEPDLVVGHSLGGYLGYYVAQKLGVPALMFQPAFGGTLTAPGGWDKLQPLPELVKNIPPHPEGKLAIFGKNDDVINNQEAMDFLKDKAEVRVEWMGHEVPGDKFISNFKGFVESIS